MKSKMLRTTIVLAAAMSVGCGSEAVPPAVTPSSDTVTPASAPSQRPEETLGKSQINVSDEILRACTDIDAHFVFDSARVQSVDQPDLAKLAECFLTGTLKGRKMRLVGHADPRGDHEYNMLLGGRRADGVKRYLVKLAMRGGQIETTSRGELDAEGTDEMSWVRDRRVDVILTD